MRMPISGISGLAEAANGKAIAYGSNGALIRPSDTFSHAQVVTGEGALFQAYRPLPCGTHGRGCPTGRVRAPWSYAIAPARGLGRGITESAGFTLLELLAVLAILAIVVLAFSFGSGRSLDTARFRALMVRTSAAITDGRADAMRSMQERVFYVDPQNRRMGYPKGGVLLEIPPGVDLTATVAQSEQYADGSLGIRFYPTGSSTGGTLAFTYRRQVYEIRVNWLTGNVSLVHG